MAFSPSIGPLANLSAISRLLDSSSSSETKSQIRPQSLACSALISSPKRPIPLALALPIKLGTNHEEPTSEMIPRFGPKTSLNFADLAAITISPDKARPTPPPAAIPFIAVTIGLPDCVIAFTKGLKAVSIFFPAD